jgi:hypothetical protein
VYLDMWLLGAVSLAVMNGGLGILLPATQPTRRRAILLMVALLLAVFIIGGAGTQSDVFSPLRMPLIVYYINPGSEISRQVFFTTIAVGLIQLVVAAVGIWAWMRWRQDKV